MMEEKLSKFEDKLHETLTQHETENQVKLDMKINKVIEQQNTYADAINKNLTTVEVVNQVPEVSDLKTIMIEARKEEQALD